MSLTREQIAEGERMYREWQEAIRDDNRPMSHKEYFDDWLREHGPALLAASRERVAWESTAGQFLRDEEVE